MAVCSIVLATLSAALAAPSAIVSIDSGKYTRTVSYEGQQVVRCGLNASTTHSQLDSVVMKFDVHRHSGDHVDVRVDNRSEASELEAILGSCSPLIPDLEQAVRDFEKDLEQSRKSADWFDAYHTYDEIITWYKGIASDYSHIAKLTDSIGKSYEGRNMPALHITGTAAVPKKKVYFQCQIHAREWISGATCQYIVHYLVTEYSKANPNPDVVALLNVAELIVVPFANPDGYAYTWSNARLWRKNRKQNSNSNCVGVDLNRNYDDHWGQGGSSTNPCSDTYMGEREASEIETRNLAEFFKEQRPIYGAIDWHSYSQLILRPYGWSRTDAPDEMNLKNVGDKMAQLALIPFGKKYDSTKSIDLYPTTGTANDWFYGEDASAGRGTVRAYGFTVELRDTGLYGFELPASQIKPQGEEIIEAAMEFIRYTIEFPLYY